MAAGHRRDPNAGYAKAIEITHLVKKYRSVVAVNDISLDVYEGEIFGFLGPNGAGKTTTIKTLLGLIFPSAGEVRVLGKPAGDIDVKQNISYLPESPYFYEHMSAREVVGFYGSLFGLSGAAKDKRVDSLLELVGLQGAGKKPLRAFSKGMLQRVGIAQALINDPKVLFFDEPTSGLDPVAHRDIRDLILHLKNEGRTLFLSSHQMSDVEMVCDRVSILNRGKIRRLGRVEDLIAGGHIEIFAENVSAHEVRDGPAAGVGHQGRAGRQQGDYHDGDLPARKEPGTRLGARQQGRRAGNDADAAHPGRHLL